MALAMARDMELALALALKTTISDGAGRPRVKQTS